MADGIELGAVERLLGNAAPGKPMSFDQIFHRPSCWGRQARWKRSSVCLAMRDGKIPPTINLDNPGVTTVMDLVPKTARDHRVDVAMSNSFGFGGTNAALILSKVRV